MLAVEAASTEGWCKYAHSVLGMRSFGASGPAKEVFKHFGFTIENVQAKARELLEHYRGRNVPSSSTAPTSPRCRESAWKNAGREGGRVVVVVVGRELEGLWDT